MGNSEVGHLNIGAGRVVMQDLPRIGDAIASGEIKTAPALTGLIDKLEAKRRHLPPDRPGLAGRRALAPGPRRGAGENPERRRRAGASVHALTDGRDTPPQSAGDDLKRLAAALPPSVPVATVSRPLLRHGPRQALGARRQGL